MAALRQLESATSGDGLVERRTAMRPGGFGALASVDSYLLLGAGRDPTLSTVGALENTTSGANIQSARIGRVNQ
jgi:hypothetical protein